MRGSCEEYRVVKQRRLFDHPSLCLSVAALRFFFLVLLLLICLVFFRPTVRVVESNCPLRDAVENRSVYVPGAGFSGFWFHLGLFRSLPSLGEYDYYCYSSGCLGVVLGFLSVPIEEAYDTCRGIQLDWFQGKIVLYDMVDEFLMRFLPPNEESFSDWLPRLYVISTSLEAGVEIMQASNRNELVDLLKRTTHIPFVTGQSWLQSGGQRYIDGGFSRMFHPPCRYSVAVPATWSTYIHSLNPAVSKEQVFHFVELGAASTFA